MVLSPIFALLANFGQNLTNDCWETRQVAASGLSSLLSKISPSESLIFMIVEKTPQNYKLSEKVGEVALDLFLRNVLSRAVILMLKDQFCDYEDINVLTPINASTSLA